MYFAPKTGRSQTLPSAFSGGIGRQSFQSHFVSSGSPNSTSWLLSIGSIFVPSFYCCDFRPSLAPLFGVVPERVHRRLAFFGGHVGSLERVHEGDGHGLGCCFRPLVAVGAVADAACRESHAGHWNGEIHRIAVGPEFDGQFAQQVLFALHVLSLLVLIERRRSPISPTPLAAPRSDPA